MIPGSSFDPQRGSLDWQRIRDLTFVEQIEFHWEIDSTNTRAGVLAEALPDESGPVLVLAERQTQGRGRGAHRWWSAPGALTFSLILPLRTLPRAHLPLFSLTVGLAICQAVEGLAPLADVALKWPNDVYVNDKKVAGVLVEIPARTLDRAVVGIGLNVNNSQAEAPAELRAHCIALCDALGGTIELSDVLLTCLQHLQRQWDQLLRQPTPLVDRWRAYDWLYGKKISVDQCGATLLGIAAGLDHDGALLVDTPLGRQRCVGGTVQVVG